MGTLDRRDYLKTVVGGAAFLTIGSPALTAVAQERKTEEHEVHSGLWKRVDAAKLREVAESAINAARAEVKAQRAINASQRSVILLGAGTDTEYRKQTTAQYQARTAEVRKTREALSRFIKSTGDSGEKQFAKFTEKGSMKEFAANARKGVIDALLHSDISPEEARTAVKALDERLSTIQEKKSFAELTGYLDHHLDELLERKMPQEDPNGLCVLILIISSLLAVLVVIAVLICIFTLGLGCQGILDQLIAQACP
jgi:hypothetical protein